MARTSDNSIPERIRRAGCWANGLYAFAIFFALGAIISFLNTDIVRALESLLLTAICIGVGIWLARRANSSEAALPGPSRPAPSRPAPTRSAPTRSTATPRAARSAPKKRSSR
ncbi:MAG TPA: hypothetical protein VHI13_00910 [Candidatus Kapabacteria bacterium]|nr:hypothetical protein [Candidatus Kapabacteria bacterium]